MHESNLLLSFAYYVFPLLTIFNWIKWIFFNGRQEKRGRAHENGIIRKNGRLLFSLIIQIVII